MNSGPLFKFLRSADVEKMMGGSILLRSLGYYRGLEVSGARWIGDRLENRVELQIDDTNDFTRIARMRPDGAPIPIVGDASSRVSNVRVSYSGGPDPYVFCASQGDDFRALCRTMCSKRDGQEPYDACVRIFDRRAFFLHVLKNGVMGPAILAPLVARSDLRPVKYEKTSYTMADGKMARPTPFTKDELFSEQCEVRFALWPKQELNQQILRVAFPEPERFLRPERLKLG